MIRPRLVKDLLKGKITIDKLSEDDVYLDVKQKGIDMKIGVDIASLSLKKFVDVIVLFSGDSVFVPAAKLARREGIDFVLDPMHANVESQLFEHIDGLECYVPYPPKKASRPHRTKNVSKKTTKEDVKNNNLCSTTQICKKCGFFCAFPSRTWLIKRVNTLSE